MALRPRRKHLVVWSSSGLPADERLGRRPARRRRIRWWLRMGVLLAVIGVRSVVRGARTRWEPVFLGVGATLMVIGFEVPAAFVTFLAGLLVLVVTLLTAIATKG